MKKVSFKNNETYLPVTLEQWSDMVNEFLVAINVVTAPKFLVAGAMEELLMQVIHHLDHDKGIVSKQALFEGCVNRLCCHMTYSSVQASQAANKVQETQVSDEVQDEPQGELAPAPALLPDEPA